MISFGEKNKRYKTPGKDVSEEFKKRSEALRSVLPATCPDKIKLGARLLDLWKSDSYCTKALDVKDGFVNALKINCHSKVFFLVCEKEFGLDKSQVSRYMNIVDEFCEHCNVKDDINEFRLTERFKVFSYSQLVELLSLNDEQRKVVEPSWSVKKIREYKKSLRKVATSQQDKEDYEEPEEYKDLTRKQLIELVSSLYEEKSLIVVALEKFGLSYDKLLEVYNE